MTEPARAPAPVPVAPPSRPQAGGVREVAVLAWPVVLQMSAETVLQLVNSAFVGRLGPTELGAVGFGGIWVWTLLVGFFGAGTGVQVFVAREDGAGERRHCGRWIWHAFYTLVPASALWTGAVAYGFAPLIAWLGPSPELQAQTLLYVHARLIGIPVVVAGGVFTGYLRGLGDTRTPMLAMLGALAVHVTTAYALIFGALGLPAWGVYGAGVAIVISEVAYTAILAACILTRRQRRAHGTAPARPDPALSLRYLRTSAPIGGQWLLDMTSFALFTSIVARMGDIEMAASQAMLQLLSLSYMQASAIAIAAGTLVGRYIGSAELDAAARSYRSAMGLALLLAAAVAGLFLGVPELLMRIFSDDARVLDLARPLLVLGAFFQVVDSTLIITSGALRGGGDTRWPFVVQATLAWVLRLPLVYGIGVALSGGLLGAWVGELLYLLVAATAFLARFRSGRWRTLRI